MWLPQCNLGWDDPAHPLRVKLILKGLGKCSKPRLRCIPGIHSETPWRLDKVTYRYSMKCFPVGSANLYERYFIWNGYDKRDSSPNANDVYVVVVRLWIIFIVFDASMHQNCFLQLIRMIRKKEKNIFRSKNRHMVSKLFWLGTLSIK